MKCYELLQRECFRIRVNGNTVELTVTKYNWLLCP